MHTWIPLIIRHIRFILERNHNFYDFISHVCEGRPVKLGQRSMKYLYWEFFDPDEIEQPFARTNVT